MLKYTTMLNTLILTSCVITVSLSSRIYKDVQQLPLTVNHNNLSICFLISGDIKLT